MIERTEYDGAKPAAEKFHTASLLNRSEVRKLALRCGAARTGCRRGSARNSLTTSRPALGCW